MHSEWGLQYFEDRLLLALLVQKNLLARRLMQLVLRGWVCKVVMLVITDDALLARRLRQALHRSILNNLYHLLLALALSDRCPLGVRQMLVV